jgi:hypothetical protein
MNKKLIREMRFMMERLESPRMTDSEVQKKYKKLNEEGNRSSFKNNFISSMEIYGHYTKHEDDIKNEVSDYIDSLSDDDFNLLTQMVDLKNGVINQDDVDVNSLMEFSGRLYNSLKAIVDKPRD